jgi:hypothetical protein
MSDMMSAVVEQTLQLMPVAHKVQCSLGGQREKCDHRQHPLPSLFERHSASDWSVRITMDKLRFVSFVCYAILGSGWRICVGTKISLLLLNKSMLIAPWVPVPFILQNLSQSDVKIPHRGAGQVGPDAAVEGRCERARGRRTAAASPYCSTLTTLS